MLLQWGKLYDIIWKMFLGRVREMEELEELKEKMTSQRPAEWEQLPDLALYMDQLISYMPRQLIRFESSGDALTSAMVNNYIKDGLLPRAEGKRYGREHLAWLTVICALKSVISMREMADLFEALGEKEKPPQERYEFFLEQLDQSLNKVAGPLEPERPEEELATLALSLALDSYASKLACQRVLGILREKQPSRDEGKKKK